MNECFLKEFGKQLYSQTVQHYRKSRVLPSINITRKNEGIQGKIPSIVCISRYKSNYISWFVLYHMATGNSHGHPKSAVLYEICRPGSCCNQLQYFFEYIYFSPCNKIMLKVL
jgi:hypothetical protein